MGITRNKNETESFTINMTRALRCDTSGCTKCVGWTGLMSYGNAENTWIEGKLIAIPK